MSKRTARAQAQPNIALIKYWGKADIAANLPAVPSLSITLDAIWTRTRVTFDHHLKADEFSLNKQVQVQGLSRVSACLDRFRAKANTQDFAKVESESNFPTAAGLASSASGFAALVFAANEALGLGLSKRLLSRWARRGSGSAARSIFSGFVEMPTDASGDVREAKPLLAAEEWPLFVVIAITATEAKKIGSTEGMQRTAKTSPFYQPWVKTSHADFDRGKNAVLSKDFAGLARISEHSCLKMHGLALSADPGLLYWNPTTVACLQEIRQLQAQGLEVFFTMDAGPQVKAVCTASAVDRVEKSLSRVPGVQSVITSHLGAGARLLQDD